METVVKRLYEALFLVDSGLAASDWDGTIEAVRGVLEKNECEILSLRKWDERRLAYEMDKKARGTYLLCYFNSDVEKIQVIEREVQLSEKIMRVLILRADKVTTEEMELETPTMKVERKAEQAKQAAEAAEAAKAAKAAEAAEAAKVAEAAKAAEAAEAAKIAETTEEIKETPDEAEEPTGEADDSGGKDEQEPDQIKQ